MVLLDPELEEVDRLVDEVEFLFSLLVEGHVLVGLQPPLPLLLPQFLGGKVLVFLLLPDVVHRALFMGVLELISRVIEYLVLQVLLVLLGQRIQLVGSLVFLGEGASLHGGRLLLDLYYFVDVVGVLGLRNGLGQVDVFQLFVPN